MVIGIDGNEANVKTRVGSGQYAFELLHQFAKDKTHQFLIFLKDKPFHNLPRESENFRYKVFGPKKLWTQFALPLRLTFGSNVDVFFSMAHYGPRFSKVPYVVTMHDLSYLHFPKMFRKNDLYQLTSWSGYSIKNSAHIIAVSQTTKEDVIKNYKIAPNKISVTYEGYDKNRFKPQPRSRVESLKSKYKIKGDYLIFVGTLQPRKNLERLIEAFHQIIRQSGHQAIRKNSPDNPTTRQPDNLKLVIAGKRGWLYDSIFEKVKSLGLSQKVIFTDYVPDDDLPALIGGAKAYVLPSLWEGFGIPVIEAQACGMPVVVSNTSSLPEIVTPPSVIPAKAGIQNKNQILDHVFDRESQTESVENDNR
ncbi:glycosyltransferase family 4 protein, partial [Candidatus Curtissbacteria bacterium]|nr:glycosyltransferase family 4 protein [Candidatus Curtissbacteria bacterium]